MRQPVMPLSPSLVRFELATTYLPNLPAFPLKTMGAAGFKAIALAIQNLVLRCPSFHLCNIALEELTKKQVWKLIRIIQRSFNATAFLA